MILDMVVSHLQLMLAPSVVLLGHLRLFIKLLGLNISENSMLSGF